MQHAGPQRRSHAERAQACRGRKARERRRGGARGRGCGAAGRARACKGARDAPRQGHSLFAAGATSSAAETAGPAENVIALLRRFEAEAAQEEARDTTAGFTLAAAPASPARATARLDRPALQIDLAALEAELALAA